MKSLSPHLDPFVFDGQAYTAAEIIDILSPYIRPGRQEKIRETVARRTYSVVPVLEAVHDRGNVSAVMRSAESMGYQGMHIIETARYFRKANRVTQGADKWLDVERWDGTKTCVDHLRSQGYRIVVTHMSEDAKSLDEISFAEPTAIFFGSEGEGASDELVELADNCVVIPMDGFSQSFNISVAAALSFYHIRHERIRELGHHADLSDAEQEGLVASYFMRSVKHSEDILQRLREKRAEEIA